ncbi:MAG: transaldolase [Nanoarchaeota archaeon]|nr:transaldolase [Nanoarchaeota archaeon]
MKVYLDTADLGFIEYAFDKHPDVAGVTTNPSLIKKAAGKDFSVKKLDSYITQILEIAGEGNPVSLEVTARDKDGIVRQANNLFNKYNDIAGNVVIKVPVNPYTNGKSSLDGLLAAKELHEVGIPVNMTLIFTVYQALVSAEFAEVAMVSPFAGRIDDYLRQKEGIEFQKSDYYPANGVLGPNGYPISDNGIVSGVHLVYDIARIFKKKGLPTKVLAASIRNPRQALEVAAAGADIATLPPSVFEEYSTKGKAVVIEIPTQEIDQRFYTLPTNRNIPTNYIAHPKTEEGIEKFTKDIIPEWEAICNGELN